LLTLGISITVLAILVVSCVLIDRMFSAPRYHGPSTDHFDGSRFHNLEHPERNGLLDFLRWQFNRHRGQWNKWTNSATGAPPPARVDGSQLRVTFINHATVLIQTEGFNILTDPIWSQRASPVSWAGPKRHRPPGIRFEDLPQIDLVLISHNHYDHLNIETLQKLKEAHGSRFITGLGNGALLRARGIDALVELDWWELAHVSDTLNVTCVPAKHFSGRGLSDGDATLWCGYVVGTSSGSIYFAGDTGMGNHFAEIKARFREIRFALFPIGAYLPRWFMCPIHLSPAEAVEVHHLLGARTSMAMHFGTFALGDDGEFEPITELRDALNDDPSFWVPGHGEGLDVP
jgi:L-ascorbate metabolism protein UlaG (beta-lactamase superfamily)